MLSIAKVTVENLETGCVTDNPHPRFSFALESDRPGAALRTATIAVGDWRAETAEQLHIPYAGPPLLPLTEYTVEIRATDDRGETARGAARFETGRLGTPWTARWITDGGYRFGKDESPAPMTFRRRFALHGKVRRARIHATALGIYTLSLNGETVGAEYFAPGFTSYGHQLQYQTYDVTGQLGELNELTAVVAGGWACGFFNYVRKNKISADRQALLMEMHLLYEDGGKEIVATDTDWSVTTQGAYRFAEFYDGETYDATVDLARAPFHAAALTAPRGAPKLLAAYGSPVRVRERLAPVSCRKVPGGETVYDFGQNIAGVICAKIGGRRGQRVVFRHAEVLVDGELFTKPLRTAKATATYICRDGEQTYSPRLTYMGFRYVGVTGVEEADLALSAFVLASDVPEVGTFECSNALVNRFEQNVRWGGLSNFVDIPTDCPQRDERQGWTGDIAVFASTACYHFDMSRFFDKWLLDMRSEQGRGGGVPMVVPRQGDRWPTMATSCWGDSCILVPWAEYLARGDLALLKAQYPAMKKFLKAARFWAGLLALGTYRRIWRFPFHFGDWCAPQGGARDWMARARWVATAYWANSCAIIAETASLLGETADAGYYRGLRAEIACAYRKVFTDGKGRLRDEFQTGYVLPLFFGMTAGAETAAMADNLARLVRDADNHLTTGFTGTPYLLFALSDNGHPQAAYDLLLQDTCPSWLYEVRSGGTTIWERWDALRPDGTVNTDPLTKGAKDDGSGGMVSFNHYANGAAGDWLYRRVLGLEATSGGYRTFRVQPLPGGGLTCAKGSHRSPYGEIGVDWHIEEGVFSITVRVPVGTACELVLPDGERHSLASGTHAYRSAV